MAENHTRPAPYQADRRAAGATVVTLHGEIDLLVVQPLRTRLDALTAGPHPDLVIDLRGVSFIDCVGLSVLCRTRNRVRARRGRLRLIADKSSFLTEQRAERHAVQAVLLTDVPRTMTATVRSADRTTASVRWTSPDGVSRTGRTSVSTGHKAGSEVTVWQDGQGHLISEPTDPATAANEAGLLGAAAALALAGLARSGRGRTMAARPAAHRCVGPGAGPGRTSMEPRGSGVRARSRSRSSVGPRGACACTSCTPAALNHAPTPASARGPRPLPTFRSRRSSGSRRPCRS
ncbi:STAS domain-containing protein [Streptomyces sp. NPDC057456]|uniref:STAS domain-containing protein n=1 Tax=Streptomyces sp. NPDC057456 TaxID=3346139 RepID=UPI0036B0CAA4